MISKNIKLERLTNEELIEHYLKTRGTLSPKTLKNYRVLLTQFFNFCHDRELDMLKISEIEVSEFLSQYEYKSTKSSYKTILNIFYKWLFKQRLIEENPVEAITIKNGRKKKVELMSDKEFKAILSHCQGLRETTIVSMFWYTGMRAKELRNLRVDDVDLDRGIIHIQASKTITGLRQIPIHPNFKSPLRRYLKRQAKLVTSHPHVFLTKRGTPFSESAIIHLIRALQLEQNKKYSCHNFRRAFITRLYRKTSDLILCQRLAGHANLNTTRRYVLSDIQEAMRKFNSINF